ncbi:MAG: T9SS type A sorting domain-containing protein [Bacteroidota bacterium]|nr:T9SS type A sorting domain-containing protein [Bacteroidota bacterium]
MDLTFGIVPNSIEVTLEPDYGGSPWNATKVVNNLLATQALLASHDHHPRFIVPAVTNAANLINWWPAMKNVNTTWLQYVDEASYHRYGSPTATQLNNNQAAVEADGKRLSQTEYIGATYHMLHEDLKRNHVAWTQYVLATYFGLDPQTAYYGINQSDPDDPQILISSLARYFRHYMRYIRTDAVRKEATTTDMQFDPVAFRNVGGNYTVVIKAATSGNVSVAGLPSGTYHIRYTTNSNALVDPGDQVIASSEQIITSIPAAGVITIYSEPSDIPTHTAGIAVDAGSLIIPNPFSTHTVFMSEVAIQDARITIKDRSGRTVRTMDHVSGNSVVIAREDLVPGLYLLHLDEGNRSSTKKLMITD